MMFSFLTRQNEDRRVADTLSALTQMSEKVEFLSTQILRSIGTEEAKLMTELYDLMIGHQCFRDLAFFGLKPTPKHILRNETFKDCMAYLGMELKVVSDVDFSLSGGRGSEGVTFESHRFNSDSDEYLKLRKEMLKILSKYNVSLEDFLNR